MTTKNIGTSKKSVVNISLTGVVLRSTDSLRRGSEWKQNFLSEILH